MSVKPIESPIVPFYFGQPRRQLYGCIHHPSQERSDCGLVLCCPTAHEYVRFHRACRQLASGLAHRGCTVLRFDFYGSGDSSGDFEESRFGLWLEDVSTAIDELRGRSRAAKMCVAGIRIGASAACSAAASRDDVDGIFMWDPVISGRAYLEEVSALHRTMVRRSHVLTGRAGTGENSTEILGYPISPGLWSDLENLDLLAVRQRPAPEALIIESHPRVAQDVWRSHLEEMRIRTKHLRIPTPPLWEWREDFSGLLVPRQIIQAAVSWFSESLQ